ncbi:MAG: glycosyltransferase family 39 protein [Elusimicrobia bacterium]|nr:glycosyltransferase family 39 protein [Elusimicrobiota bacterium]
MKTIRALTIAAALAAPLCWLSHPLWEVDDARYAQIPRTMLSTGDWATPRLNGFDYVEKPPLWYWLAAASYKAFGVTEGAARLPLALLSLLTAAGIWWLGSWLFPGSDQAAGPVVFSTSLMVLVLSHLITLDMALTAFLLWCTAMILRALARPEDAAWAGPLAWVFAGLAFLSKGLVALLFPVAWSVALVALFPALRRGWRGLLGPAGPLLFVVIAAPWFAAMEDRHPGFLRFFFVEQHFQRFLTPKYNRPAPWYFYAGVLTAGLLPWTSAALAGLARAWRDARAPAREWRGAALALWAVGVIAFFSVSRSKLATYILPAFPHLGLLAARALQEHPPRWSRRLAAALGAVLLAGACAAWLAGWGAAAALLPAKARLPDPALGPWAGGASAALGLGLLWWRRRPAGWIGPALGSLAACGLAFTGMARVETFVSAKALGLSIAARARPGDLVYSYGTFLHGLPFYAGRRVDRMVYWVGELHYALRDPANEDRFGDDNTIRSLPLRGRTVFVALRRSEAAYFRTLVRPEHLVSYEPFGRWMLAEVSHSPPRGGGE